MKQTLVAIEAAFGDLGYRHWQARVQLDLAEWLARQSRLDEATALADAAALTFAELRVDPILARARALSALQPSGH